MYHSFLSRNRFSSLFNHTRAATRAGKKTQSQLEAERDQKKPRWKQQRSYQELEGEKITLASRREGNKRKDFVNTLHPPRMDNGGRETRETDFSQARRSKK